MRWTEKGDVVVAELEFPSLPHFIAFDQRDVEVFVEGLDEAGDEAANAVLFPDVDFHSRPIVFEFVEQRNRTLGAFHSLEDVTRELCFRAAMDRSCEEKETL